MASPSADEPPRQKRRRRGEPRLLLIKAAAEVFGAVSIPMASCDPDGRVRVANPAFLEFLGVAGDAVDLQLRDSALPEIYPELFDDLAEVAAKRRPIKRIIDLH